MDREPDREPFAVPPIPTDPGARHMGTLPEVSFSDPLHIPQLTPAIDAAAEYHNAVLHEVAAAVALSPEMLDDGPQDFSSTVEAARQHFAVRYALRSVVDFLSDALAEYIRLNLSRLLEITRRPPRRPGESRTGFRRGRRPRI